MERPRSATPAGSVAANDDVADDSVHTNAKANTAKVEDLKREADAAATAYSEKVTRRRVVNRFSLNGTAESSSRHVVTLIASLSHPRPLPR
jgi:hypothetical protein